MKTLRLFLNFCAITFIFNGVVVASVPWDIKVVQGINRKDQIEVYGLPMNGKSIARLLLRVGTDNETDGLVSYDVKFVPAWKKNVLVTIWTAGAHSEIIKVFDLDKTKKKQICKYYAEGPPAVTVRGNYLNFSVPYEKFAGEMDPSPRDFTVNAKFMSKECH